MKAVVDKIEHSYGALMTYVAAAANVGIGAWLEENWFLLLSAVAVIVRIGIDLPRLWEAWKKKKPEEE